MDNNTDDEMFITQNSFCDVPKKENSEDEFQFRFADILTKNDLKKKVKICIPKATGAKNAWAVGVFKRWQAERCSRTITENLDLPRVCLTMEIVNMDRPNLDKALKYFVFEARKVNGTKYPAKSLYELFTSIQSFMRSEGININLFEEPEFAGCRRSLDAAMRELSSEGYGTALVKHTSVIEDDEEEKLWNSGGLGDDNPKKLLDTVLYLTGLHFALRGGREHRNLRLHLNPQITGPHTDAQGHKYILYTEDVSKCNAGGIKTRKLLPKKVRAYQNDRNPARCYVKIFEKYRSLCPFTKADFFYFVPRETYTDNDWYYNKAVGHNTLATTIKRLCTKHGIKGKTNHSLRATAATRLYRGNVEDQMICEVTGHRSEAVRIYKRASDEQKATVSSIVGGEKRRKTEKTASTTNIVPDTEKPSTTTNTVSKHEKTSAMNPIVFNISIG